MKLKKLGTLLFLSIMLIACGSDDNSVPVGDDDMTSDNPTDSAPSLLSASGTQIIAENGSPLQLNGVAFSNYHWIEDPLPPAAHHSELDYERLADMGMNVVRFGMNYWIFEDDSAPYQYKQTGWDWIDNNVQWAKDNGVYLILNMHTPQGGYQSQGTGDALWDEVENQNRLVALWRAIAERYADEPQIAGYGIVNEPIPSQSMQQWSQLAQRLIGEIRQVDDHLIMVEQAIAVKGQVTFDDNLNFPVVTGDNIMYEFHTYQPFLFTHQLLQFANQGDGGVYPDEDVLEVADSQWYTAIYNNPLLTENSDWQFFEGERYLVDDSEIALGTPVVITGNIGANGTVNFDDIQLNEFDENGSFVRTIKQNELNAAPGWSFWSRNEDGDGGVDESDGRTDTTSLFITGATDESNLSNVFANFEPIQGYSYQISGWMKASGMANGGDALIRIDFYQTDGEVYRRNRAFLESILDDVQAWSNAQNRPVYVGEFGAGTPSFENDKGGLNWASDMVDLLLEKDIHFTYFDYHGDTFGIYKGPTNALPDISNASQPIIDMFTDKLR